MLKSETSSSMKVALLGGACVGLLIGAEARAEIRLPAKAPENVRWAAANLKADLAAHGVSDRDSRVVVEVSAGDGMESAGQSYGISRDGDTVRIKAGGAVGAMYALHDLAEQWRHGPSGGWPALAAATQTGEHQPWVTLRADNAFLHSKPLLLSDVPMWRQYIDMLAKDRFNLLDVHGIYNLDTTSFPNIYPMLVTVKDYPKAGAANDRKKNLADFKAIVAYAKSRGVRVSLMNYSLTEAVPDGAPRRTKDNPIDGVSPDKLADYTAKATAELIKQVPDLYQVGFRVGETGQPASFFKDAYLRGVKMANRPDLRLYTRSWLTTQDQLDPIADAVPGRFDVQIKYNGENLGLPYHAMQERFGTYSYEHYLNKPANFRIIWQVRANGTHRFWAWENTDFVRRTARTMRLGQAAGFTLESPTSYFSVHPQDIYRSPQDQAVFDYTWKKQWAWYFAWGRLGYDPDLPEARVVDAYRDHYGEAAGPKIYAAMQQASQVVPLVYAYRFIGADHRDFAPETETGYTSNDSVVGSRTPIPETLLQYIQDRPEDQRAFKPVGEYVLDNMADIPDGRIGPWAVAKTLRDAAAGTKSAVEAAPEPIGAAAGEWRLVKADLLAAAHLGDYHADRIEGLLYIDHAVRTNERADFDKGRALLVESRAAWADLARTTQVYRPLSNTLRRQRDFTWDRETARLERLDATADNLWDDRPKGAHNNPLRRYSTDDGSTGGLAIAGAPTTQVTASGKSVVLTVKATGDKPLARVALWWKPLPSDGRWRSQEMVFDGAGQYRAEVPYTFEGVMYHVELQDVTGAARNFPLVQRETPYWILGPDPRPSSSQTAGQ